MSTQFYTQDQPATSQPGTRRAPRPHRDGPSWYRIAAVIIGAVAAAALIVLAISGLTGSSHPAPAPAPRATASQPASPAPDLAQGPIATETGHDHAVPYPVGASKGAG